MTTGTATAIRARLADLVDDGGPAAIAFVERLVASFLERQAGLLARLAEAISQADAGAVARHAHALKGAAGNVGAAEVASLCAEAEDLATAGQPDRLGGYPDRLRAALAEAAEELPLAVAGLRAELSQAGGGYA
jgi:HPt (histidine-containing phosphotransfer) domain-containing protein